MKKSLVLAAAAVAAIGAVGCTSRPLQSVFHRGAPCGGVVMSPDATTTYSPGCGMPDCPTCGTTSGMPMLGGGFLDGYTVEQSPLPVPGE